MVKKTVGKDEVEAIFDLEKIENIIAEEEADADVWIEQLMKRQPDTFEAFQAIFHSQYEEVLALIGPEPPESHRAMRRDLVSMLVHMARIGFYRSAIRVERKKSAQGETKTKETTLFEGDRNA